MCLQLLSLLDRYLVVSLLVVDYVVLAKLDRVIVVHSDVCQTSLLINVVETVYVLSTFVFKYISTLSSQVALDISLEKRFMTSDDILKSNGFPVIK